MIPFDNQIAFECRFAQQWHWLGLRQQQPKIFQCLGRNASREKYAGCFSNNLGSWWLHRIFPIDRSKIRDLVSKRELKRPGNFLSGGSRNQCPLRSKKRSHVEIREKWPRNRIRNDFIISQRWQFVKFTKTSPMDKLSTTGRFTEKRGIRSHNWIRAFERKKSWENRQKWEQEWNSYLKLTVDRN